MDQANPEGVSAPVESVPAVAPEGAAPEAVKPAAEPPAAKPEAKSDDEPKGVAKRLKELTEARRAAEAREDRLARLLEETLRGRAAPEKPETTPKTFKDFNYDDKAYQDYLYAEARKAAEQAAKEAGTKWKAEQEAIQRRAKFDERVAQFKGSVEDFDDVVTPSTPVSEAMADAIMDSDEAGAVLYYLGQNPDVATKLYHLSPAKAGREIQKIEDRLVAERKKAAEKPVSQAPPPAPKIEAAEAAIKVKSTSDPDSDKLSDKEWFALAEKERLRARKRD